MALTPVTTSLYDCCPSGRGADLAGAQVQDEKVCFALLRSSILNASFWFSAMYLATVIVTVISVQRYTEFSTGQSCYTDNPGPSSAILPGFLSLGALEIGLFGITMYRVLSQYRTTSGRLLNLLPVLHQSTASLPRVTWNSFATSPLEGPPLHNGLNNDGHDINGRVCSSGVTFDDV
ncbi:hypothetical protein M405DRAFT_908855 [Rhizopogon salebrosus TDB-379]|nr:hypothetical protein M405DRAFT_908855 [Rhizopogon salebrosus TDB-379]